MPLYNISVKPILNVSHGLTYVVYLVVFLYRLILFHLLISNRLSLVLLLKQPYFACLDETSLSFESDMPFFFILSLRPISHSFVLRLLASDLQLNRVIFMRPAYTSKLICISFPVPILLSWDNHHVQDETLALAGATRHEVTISRMQYPLVSIERCNVPWTWFPALLFYVHCD